MAKVISDLVRLYLQEIGRYPLLSAEEEIKYARQVEQMIKLEKSRESLRQQLKRVPTNFEIAETLNQSESEIEKILLNGRQAKQKMITANLRLVVSVA